MENQTYAVTVTARIILFHSNVTQCLLICYGQQLYASAYGSDFISTSIFFVVEKGREKKEYRT
ncbi:GMP synthase-like glutamine amidotransferase [Aquibacillus albus]|uniref:GMP synthase-like glutamine amidotransferase n=1 Tax=Aquibacillus albus TaxID=1168171 RepID=A0ABS2N5Q3_9BACI|nr:GMP synthase-like glutamine amidotransferase [Aquibacillus albus]